VLLPAGTLFREGNFYADRHRQILQYRQGLWLHRARRRRDKLADYAIRYFDDFVKPTKSYRAPDDVEQDALAKLSDALAALPAGADGEAIQNAALNVARHIERYQDHSKQSPEGGPGVSVAFFQMIYQVLIGQERGPRFGSFAALYGIAETRGLIEKALKGQLAA